MVKHFTLAILLCGLSELASRAAEPQRPFDLSEPFDTHAPIRLHLDTPIPAELLVQTRSEFVCIYDGAFTAAQLRWGRPSFQDIRLYAFSVGPTIRE